MCDFTRCAILVAALMGLVGCDSRPKLPKTYPSVGSVAYKDGQPMKGGSIRFSSDADPMLRVFAEIQENGNFTLSTIKDNARELGAPEGEYKVVIYPALAAKDQDDLKVAHQAPPPIALEGTYKVEAKENTFRFEVPAP
jgi:hypothetical protein